MGQANTDRFRFIVDDEVERTSGRDAQQMNFAAARALAAGVRTTFGPRGLDKMLVSREGTVVVTNDGAGILDRVSIDNPAAEMVVAVARDQDEHVGDGATTAVLLTGALLDRAATLIERGVHPTTVSTGYRMASQRVQDHLESSAIDVSREDSDRLRQVARTVVTGRWSGDAAAFMADLAVEAALAVEANGRLDLRRISRTAIPGGRFRDSRVIDGLVIDTDESSTTLVTPDVEFPRRIEDARIALIDNGLTIETPGGLGGITFGDPSNHGRLLEYEDGVYADQVATIERAGADVVFCQQSIDDSVRYLLARAGILPVERTRRDEFIQLGRATGARHVGTVEHLSATDIGRAGLVERQTVGGRALTVVSGSERTEQISLLLRGGSKHVVSEVDRIVEGCLRVLSATIEGAAVLPGGGAIEVELAGDLREYARSIGAREQLAIEAFADALETIPRTLAANAGFDAIDTLLALRRHHREGAVAAGIDLRTGTVVDMLDTGVVEPVALKRRAIGGAEEAANMLVRVDDVLASAPDQSEDEHEHDHGPGGFESTGGYPWAVGHSMGH